MATRIGYVFCVDVDNQYKRFFQYIADDMGIYSRVIRIFKRRGLYPEYGTQFATLKVE